MVYYYYIYRNNNVEVIIIIIIIVRFRPVTQANQAHSFSVETAHRNNLVAQRSNKYPLAFDPESVCSKLRHEISLLLWLDTELLNANVLHHVETAKGSSVQAVQPP